jgi:hypothetical protein
MAVDDTGLAFVFASRHFVPRQCPGWVPGFLGEIILGSPGPGNEERDSECSIGTLMSDIWNQAKKDLLFDNVVQVDTAFDVTWGSSVDGFDRNSVALGINTLGQVVLTAEAARNLDGHGAIISGNVGMNITTGTGPTSSGHSVVEHQQASGGFGRYAGTVSITSGGNSHTGSLPGDPLSDSFGRAKLAPSVALGIAYMHGMQDQFVSATKPWFSPPEFSGCGLSIN